MVRMKNFTMAIDKKTLEAGRKYAQRHRTTLSALVRDLLRRTVMSDRQAALTEMWRLMDAHPGDSRGERWTRDELYGR